MNIALAEIGYALGIADRLPPATIAGWSVDSRTLRPGDLFFALRGPRHDGHDYVAAAFEKGAAAAVVERAADNGNIVLTVPDTQRALKALGSWARRHWNGTVIGVTGSAGKTTTKDIIADLLATEMRVGKTAGNYNNHVGLPLSILNLPDQARVAVLEMGMNHAGEIRSLAAVAAPQIGVVTAVGRAHLEFFDSIEAVALAKRELIESLPGDGVAVLNADDPLVARFAAVHAGKVVTFGTQAAADFRAEEIEIQPAGSRFRAGGTVFETQLLGRHQVRNILAGLAVASLFGIAPERLREPVRALRAAAMRGERLERAGVTVWNDCYNSNPDALRLMLDALGEASARRRIAVLGEMLELGRWAEGLHGDLGRYVAMSNVSVLLGIRGAARHLVDAARDSGMAIDAAYFFEQPEAAGEFLRGVAAPGDLILFKGSRATRVERAMEKFLE